jgi:hypothetical protein
MMCARFQLFAEGTILIMGAVYYDYAAHRCAIYELPATTEED